MTSKQRILLIEDSPEFAMILRSWLSKDLQADVVHVTDLPEARELLATQKWDTLFTDIELPSGNCFELVEYAKAAQPTMRILVMTSHARTDYLVEALRLKADEFLFKPFEKNSWAALARMPSAA